MGFLTGMLLIPSWCLRLGYKAWVGPFSPKGTPAGKFLSLYAERFPLVEGDLTDAR